MPIYVEFDISLYTPSFTPKVDLSLMLNKKLGIKIGDIKLSGAYIVRSFLQKINLYSGVSKSIAIVEHPVNKPPCPPCILTAPSCS